MATEGEGGALPWKDIAQVLLAGAGVIGIAFVAIGWLRWAAYLSYFDVPMGAVDLGLRDMAASSGPWIFLVGWIAFAAAAMRYPFSKGDLVVMVAGVVLAITLIAFTFLNTLSNDSLETALARTGLTALIVLLALASAILATEMTRRRITPRFLLILVFFILIVAGSAWGLGSLMAYGRWHSDHREDKFQTVVLYSETQLFEGWEQRGDVFVSPELMLIVKAGDTFVVIDGDSPDKATVISADVITHADYIRD
jgi:hypothetical protein